MNRPTCQRCMRSVRVSPCGRVPSAVSPFPAALPSCDRYLQRRRRNSSACNHATRRTSCPPAYQHRRNLSCERRRGLLTPRAVNSTMTVIATARRPKQLASCGQAHPHDALPLMSRAHRPRRQSPRGPIHKRSWPASKVEVRFPAPLPSTAETETLMERTGVRPRFEEHPEGRTGRTAQTVATEQVLMTRILAAKPPRAPGSEQDGAREGAFCWSCWVRLV